MEFKGNAADALYKHICHKFDFDDEYFRQICIIQSSGMGKSRLVDELSKKHVVVPICLRPKDSTG